MFVSQKDLSEGPSGNMPTQPLRKGKPLKYPPPEIRIGDIGTYSIGGDRYGFTVTNIRNNGRSVDILHDDIDQETIEWRISGRWVTSGVLGRSFRGSYKFGYKVNYQDPGY